MNHTYKTPKTFLLYISSFLLVVVMLNLMPSRALATILFAGGEDIDFPGGISACVITTAGTFRSAYARESITPCTPWNVAQSNQFNGGGVTNLWLSTRVYEFTNCCSGGANAGFIGVGKSGTLNSLWVGTNNSNPWQLSIWTFNGATWTKLANESGGSLFVGVSKVDLQITNYGAAGTASVYVNGSSTPVVTYTGAIAVGGATSLDTVFLTGGNNGSNYGFYQSEIIASTADTRSVSLATLAPNGAGTTNQWTGAYTNINPTSVNDTSNINDNNSGDVFQCTVTAPPAGSFSVQAVKVAARAAQGGSGLTSVSVGLKTNGSPNTPAATLQALSFATTETYYNVNPITTINWTTTDLGTLQTNFTSAP